MLKKNAKKLLISILSLILITAIYICLPFFIKFDDVKRKEIEDLISKNTSYQINISGGIKYKVSPFPVVEITEIYLTSERENSIINKITINVSIFDLLKNKFSFGNILFNGGEFIININNLNQLSLIKEFEKNIIFEEVNIKFFDQKNSFNFNKFNGKILFKNNQIDKINGVFNLGEISFKVDYKYNELSIESKKINFKANIENILSNNKKIKLNYNNTTIFPGINEIFATLNFDQDKNNFYIKTEKFKTNLFDGIIRVDNNNDKNLVVIEGNFEKANLKKISLNQLAQFLQKNLSILANIIDAKIILSFEKFKSNNQIFNNARLNLTFQDGDIFFEDITFHSEESSINIKGRNIQYQKDNLFFYDLVFKTINLKNICNEICDDKSFIEKMENETFELKSKGILNINKAKVTIEENFTNKQFNDNELKKLNLNLNSKVIFGKLENLFDFSRYFTLL